MAKRLIFRYQFKLIVQERQNRLSQPLIGLWCKCVGGVVGKSATLNTETRMRDLFDRKCETPCSQEKLRYVV